MAESFKISYNDAVEYITNFVQHERLNNISQREALGGVVSVDSINGAKKIGLENYTGNMAWFCYNPHDLKAEGSDVPYPKLFLAFEEYSTYKHGERVYVPEHDNLGCPSKDDVFTFPGDENSTTQEIEAFIAGQSFAGTKASTQMIGKSHVELLKTQYDVLRNQANLNMNIHPYGFFENRKIQDVIEFVNQGPIEYVRYFFGFSKKNDHDKSRIRIILFGADKDGKNLIPATRGEVIEGEAIILQKSWPPPTSPD